MLGTELRKARETAKLTQENLADRAGVHRTYISLLERGEKSPTVDTLKKICRVLDIRVSTLLARAGD
jgi:transcriptional regulator with XRE-family HTH domain